MPIWVPFMGKLFGVPFNESFFKENSKGLLIGSILKLFGQDPASLSIPGIRFPYVFWVTFTAQAIDENTTWVPSL